MRRKGLYRFSWLSFWLTSNISKWISFISLLIQNQATRVRRRMTPVIFMYLPLWLDDKIGKPTKSFRYVTNQKLSQIGEYDTVRRHLIFVDDGTRFCIHKYIFQTRFILSFCEMFLAATNIGCDWNPLASWCYSSSQYCKEKIEKRC